MRAEGSDVNTQVEPHETVVERVEMAHHWDADLIGQACPTCSVIGGDPIPPDSFERIS